MTPRPGPADESGMTLIEIMIALVILAVVVVGVLALLATLVRASDLSNRKTEAEAGSIAAAEYLKSVDFDHGAADCVDRYTQALAAYTASYPTAGFAPTVTVYRADSTNVTGGGEINVPAAPATPCLDGHTPAIRLSVTYAATDGGVSRTQDVVLRCNPSEATAAGSKCV